MTRLIRAPASAPSAFVVRVPEMDAVQLQVEPPLTDDAGSAVTHYRLSAIEGAAEVDRCGAPGMPHLLQRTQTCPTT